jgi:hypothetical protein
MRTIEQSGELYQLYVYNYPLNSAMFVFKPLYLDYSHTIYYYWTLTYFLSIF